MHICYSGFMFLAAQQATLINTNQRADGGFDMGFLILPIAGVVISIAMLKSKAISRVIAYVGVPTFTISLVDYIRVVFMPSVSLLLTIIAIASGLLLLVWLVLILRVPCKLNRTTICIAPFSVL